MQYNDGGRILIEAGRKMLDHSVDEKALRNFGFLVGGLFFVVAAILFYKGKITAFTVFGGIAGAFFLLALVRSSLLAGAYVWWMKFADVVGRFNTRVILSLIYTIVFTLSRVLLFVFRKDLLGKKFDSSLDSYWSDHEPMGNDPKRYDKQF
mgnify:CR=1 FL=1